MNYELILQPAANRDLRGHADYIGASNLAAALRFTEAMEAALKKLREAPETGGLCGFRAPKLRDVRVWPLTRFRNYVIFYRVVGASVFILRILHAARNAEKLLKEEPSP